MPIADLALRRNGVLIDVALGASAPYRAALWRQGKAAPPPVRAIFLIDTGCDSTTVSEQLMRTLALPATSTTRVITGTTGPQGQTADVFAVELTLLPHVAQPRTWSAWEVVALPLVNQSIDGLLGRDVLDCLVLNYDGPRKMATLTY